MSAHRRYGWERLPRHHAGRQHGSGSQAEVRQHRFLREAHAYQDALARDEARRVGLMGSSREVGSGGLECHGKSAASQPMERAGDLR